VGLIASLRCRGLKNKVDDLLCTSLRSCGFFFPQKELRVFFFSFCSVGFCSFVNMSRFDSIFVVQLVKKQG
jgi:hypothetical protein